MEPVSIILGGGLLIAWLKNRKKTKTTKDNSSDSGSSLPSGDAIDFSNDPAYQEYLKNNSQQITNLENEINDYIDDYNEVIQDQKFVSENVDTSILDKFDFADEFGAVGTPLEDFYDFTDSESLANLGISFESGSCTPAGIDPFMTLRFRIDSIPLIFRNFTNGINYDFTLNIRVFNPTNSVVTIPVKKFKIKNLTYGYKNGFPLIEKNVESIMDLNPYNNEIQIGEDEDGNPVFVKSYQNNDFFGMSKYDICKKYDSWDFYHPKIEARKMGSVVDDNVIVDAYNEALLTVVLKNVVFKEQPNNPNEFSVDIIVSRIDNKRSGFHGNVSLLKASKPAIYDKNVNYDLNADLKEFEY